MGAAYATSCSPLPDREDTTKQSPPCQAVDPDELVAAAASHRMVTMVQQRLLRIDGVPQSLLEALRGEVFRVQTSAAPPGSDADARHTGA